MRAYRHPSILPLYCSFVTRERAPRLLLVTPFMSGGSVAHILR
jgi:serine/threonine protein kinase